MKILVINDEDIFTYLGGAELNLKSNVENAPNNYKITFVKTQDVTLSNFTDKDCIIFGNIRTSTPMEINSWVYYLTKHQIPFVKSEHDMMWSDNRVGSEVTVKPDFSVTFTPQAIRSQWYYCVENLFHQASAIRYLSPIHKKVFETLNLGRSTESFIASSYIDRSIFKNEAPFEDRFDWAVCKRALNAGFINARKYARSKGWSDLTTLPINVSPEVMNNFYNLYKYHIAMPLFVSTFGRAEVESYLCGMELHVNPNHALHSFGSIEEGVASTLTANEDFWKGIKEVIT